MMNSKGKQCKKGGIGKPFGIASFSTKNKGKNHQKIQNYCLAKRPWSPKN